MWQFLCVLAFMIPMCATAIIISRMDKKPPPAKEFDRFKEEVFELLDEFEDENKAGVEILKKEMDSLQELKKRVDVLTLKAGFKL